MCLPTRGFSFLNISERSLPLIHREHFVYEDKKRVMARFFQNLSSYPMLTDFEHDRRQMILRFPHTERQRNFIFQLSFNYFYFKYLINKSLIFFIREFKIKVFCAILKKMFF